VQKLIRCDRVVGLILLGAVGLAAPAALAAADDPWADSAAPNASNAKAEPVASPDAPGQAAPPLRPVEKPGGEMNTGLAPEAGTPGWMLNPISNESELEWHGNIELDAGQVRYTWDQDSFKPETVYDARGRFVLGPMLHHKFGNGLFLRATGQLVAWVREDFQIYQGNADDVYAQIGKKGVWDVMLGRFLTWRVFRKGLGFDLYTLEDTGARTKPNFSEPSGSFEHVYEVSTIFMRDSFGPNPVPGGRAALHLYPTSWWGIEAVSAYGRLVSGGNVLGGRLATGIKVPFLNVLGGAEYVTWTPPQELTSPSPDPVTGLPVTCDTCGKTNVLGFGGSAQLTPFRSFEVTFDYARRIAESWNPQSNIYTKVNTVSWGGNAQLDVGSFFMHRSLALGGGFFRTEKADNYDLFERHDQMVGFLVYALGFNNAVVKLVASRASGEHQEKDVAVHGDMFSVRLRFGFYF
jgi:hypothetical protein